MSIDSVLAPGMAPIIAILRGIRPTEAVGVGHALLDAGIRLIEVPMNSPEPLSSIARLHAAMGHRAVIGAGTVLNTGDVEAAFDVGARFIVSPNTNPAVIRCTLEFGIDSLPGFFTATEAFSAIAAGAHHLKLFPAHCGGIKHLAAMREVMPRAVHVWAVGGIGIDNAAEWLDRGATGVAIGGALFQPGNTVAQVADVARDLVAACKREPLQNILARSELP